MECVPGSSPSKQWDFSLGVLLGVTLVFLTMSLLPDLTSLQMDREIDRRKGVNQGRATPSREGVNLERDKRSVQQQDWDNLDSMTSHHIGMENIDLQERYVFYQTALFNCSRLNHVYFLFRPS